MSRGEGRFLEDVALWIGCALQSRCPKSKANSLKQSYTDGSLSYVYRTLSHAYAY